jgi:hypothetical protein
MNRAVDISITKLNIKYTYLSLENTPLQIPLSYTLPTILPYINIQPVENIHKN